MLKLKEDYWLKIPVILYTIGFIVHNVYLSQFGSHEFELIQAKYILSGFGLIGFSAVCFAFTSIRVNLSYIPDTFSSLTKALLLWSNDFRHLVKSVNYTNEVNNETTKKIHRRI